MRSILRELYNGNIHPDISFYPQDSPFVKAARTRHDCMEKLLKTLDDSERELFEKYCESQADIDDIVRYDKFTYGLRFGILLMIEVFDNVSTTTNK